MAVHLDVSRAHADDPDLVAAMTHPSNPDRLMAQAPGVCWHSAARGPSARCDGDPIECNHEAALGEAEEKLRQVRRLLAFYNSNDPEFRERHERYFLRALGEAEIREEWRP